MGQHSARFQLGWQQSQKPSGEEQKLANDCIALLDRGEQVCELGALSGDRNGAALRGQLECMLREVPKCPRLCGPAVCTVRDLLHMEGVGWNSHRLEKYIRCDILNSLNLFFSNNARALLPVMASDVSCRDALLSIAVPSYLGQDNLPELVSASLRILEWTATIYEVRPVADALRLGLQLEPSMLPKYSASREVMLIRVAQAMTRLNNMETNSPRCMSAYASASTP